MLDDYEDETDIDQPETPEILWECGGFACEQTPPKPIPLGDSPDTVRAGLRKFLDSQLDQTTPGAVLVRYPPGTGKTTTFATLMQESWLSGLNQVLIAVPKIDQAEQMAKDCGFSVLSAINEKNCQLMKNGTDKEKESRSRHMGDGHISTLFCRQCKYYESCEQYKGQYRKEVKDFLIAVQQGRARYAMTKAMLAAHAETVLKSPQGIIWIDEDCIPQIATPVNSKDHEGTEPSNGVTIGELRSWLFHAELQRDLETDYEEERSLVADCIARIKQFTAEQAKALDTDTQDAHSDKDGYYLRIADKSLADRAKKCMPDEITHETETMSEAGRRLSVGNWRPPILSRLCNMLMGAAWVYYHKADERKNAIKGCALNRAMFSLPSAHRVLFSDATAHEKLWKAMMGKNYRGTGDASPARALRADWAVGSVRKESHAKNVPILCGKIQRMVAEDAGQVGIITYKDWVPKIKARLNAMRIPSVIADGKKHPGAAVVLGWYGAHDRAANDFEDCQSLILAGTYRPPKSAAHQLAACLGALGVDVPSDPFGMAERAGPADREGKVVFMRGNRATKCADGQTAWLLDAWRGAALSQALERLRGISRAAKGLTPAYCYIWGADPCGLRFWLDFQWLELEE
jgi:hypothetical protein